MTALQLSSGLPRLPCRSCFISRVSPSGGRASMAIWSNTEARLSLLGLATFALANMPRRMRKRAATMTRATKSPMTLMMRVGISTSPPPEPGLPSECRSGCSVPVANQRQSHQQGRDLGLTPANQSSPACRALVQSRDKAGARRPAESKWSEEIAKTGSLRIFLALFIPTSDVRLWVSTAPKMIFSGYSPMPRLPNFLVYLIARALIRHTERRYLSSCRWGFSETCYSAHQLTRKITLL